MFFESEQALFMNIVVIHQNFLRFDAEGGSRFNEMTRVWVEAGHDVTVISSQVNYKKGERPAEFEGHWLVEEEQEGVRVLRVYTPPTVHDSTIGRMWAFAAFAVSASAAVLSAVDSADVLVATSPNLLVVVPGLLGKWMRRWPLVFEVRDLWPESAVATGVLSETSPITRGLYLLERIGYLGADRINVLTPAFRENILARKLSSAQKICFIPNGADLELFSPGTPDQALREELGWEDKFVVLYAGAHGIANHLWQYIDTAERLKERDDILLVSVGSGPQKEDLVAETKRRGLTNLQWLDGVPKAQMPALVRASDVNAAILKRTDTFKTVYPNKIFDSMASGRAVICVIDGVARKLVEEAEAGVFVEPEDADDFAEKIVALADDPEGRARMGENGRRYVEQNFDRHMLAERYLSVLTEIAKKPQIDPIGWFRQFAGVLR